MDKRVFRIYLLSDLKTFFCDSCGSLLFFENTQCLKCGGSLGFLPDVMDLGTLDANKQGKWRARGESAKGRQYRPCANGVQHQVCNWMVPAEDSNELCEACRLNQVIPDLGIAGNQERWHKLEIAKRRVLYTLKHLRVPTDDAAGGNRPPLRFSFLADSPGKSMVMTGHANGLITLNIAEADDAAREQRRMALRETYRTLLGHLRHEIAHYYWDFLIGDSPRRDKFRKLFGDESVDYQNALQAHYQQGPPPNWRQSYVSAYASAHPWEDWAETFAHYLHIQDMVETASSFGLSLRPRHPAAEAMTADLKEIDELEQGFDRILSAWFPLTYALNEVNRGMGLPDIYPFALSDQAVAKLRFVHEVVQGSRTGSDRLS